MELALEIASRLVPQHNYTFDTFRLIPATSMRDLPMVIGDITFGFS
jgi:hypothetical protein